MAAPWRSTMAYSLGHISASPCPFGRAWATGRKRARMARSALMQRSGFACTIALVMIAGCAAAPLKRERTTVPPVPDRAAASAAVLTECLELLQKLMQSGPAEQAEILATSQREFDLA